MNTLDRIVRIVYKELDLRDYIHLDRGVCSSARSYSNFTEKINKAFSIDNCQVKERIKTKYLEIYPENYNPDEVDVMIDWVEKELKEAGFNNYLGIYVYVADKLIKQVNGELRVSFPNYLEWHGFMNKADYNLFYAAYLAKNARSKHSHSSYILHDNNSLYSRLKGGIAENHMHIKGSGYTTDMNWYEFIREKPYEEKSFERFLRPEYLSCPKHILAFQKLRIIRLYLSSILAEDKLCWKCILKVLEAENVEELELYYMYLCKKLSKIYKIEEYVKEEEDKIERIYGIKKKYILCERIFLQRLFELYIDKKLTDFEIYLFNIYILGLNKIKFEFVQDNNEMGFESFKTKENVKEGITKLKGYENLDIYLTVFDNYYSEKYIKYVEFRIAPKKSVEDYIKTIDEIDLANEIAYRRHRKINKNIEKIEYSIIVHYIKCKKEFEERPGLKRKERTLHNLKKHANVLDNFLSLEDEFLISNYGYKSISSLMEENQDYNFDKSYIDYIDQYNLKKKYKEIDYYKSKIVGVDTANYELNFRPENFGSIYRFHRKIHSKNNNINFTYHVGEDFNTIANGLRAIDEVIEFLGFGRGDRLGHAVALGLDIETYFVRKRDKLSSTIEDYLDDIAWMYQIISNGNENNTDLLRFLEDEFSKYKNIYLESTDFQDIDINEYLDSYNLRGDDPEVYIKLLERKKENKRKYIDYDDYYTYITGKYRYRLNHNNPRHKPSFYNKTARQLYYSYHYDYRLKRNSRKVLMFDVDKRYIDSVKLCQKLLKKKVYELEIKIETNPSSNKKISSIDKFIELPLLNFNQYGLSNKTTDYDIPVSINTDDSAIFQTNLVSEYSYIVAALIREGFNREEIYDYIEYLAKLSIEHNFTNKF